MRSKKAYGKWIPLEEVKRLEVDILTDVAAFCEREGLRYSLCAGTLLGAVRHRGFIPWDDDIDIMMPREDFDRFVREYRSEGPYRVMTHDVDPNYPLPFASVNDTRTVKIEHKLRDRCNRTLGVNVDVFPLDAVPGNLEEAAAFYREIGARWQKRTCIVDRFGKGKTLFSTLYRNVAIAFYRLLEALHLTSIHDQVSASVALATRYNPGPCGRTGVTTIYHYAVRESHPSEVYDGRTGYIFEGHTFQGLTHAHEYLSGMYGDDYMQLPPEEKRITHHTSDCYWKI